MFLTHSFHFLTHLIKKKPSLTLNYPPHQGETILLAFENHTKFNTAHLCNLISHYSPHARFAQIGHSALYKYKQAMMNPASPRVVSFLHLKRHSPSPLSSSK